MTLFACDLDVVETPISTGLSSEFTASVTVDPTQGPDPDGAGPSEGGAQEAEIGVDSSLIPPLELEMREEGFQGG